MVFPFCYYCTAHIGAPIWACVRVTTFKKEWHESFRRIVNIKSLSLKHIFLYYVMHAYIWIGFMPVHRSSSNEPLLAFSVLVCKRTHKYLNWFWFFLFFFHFVLCNLLLMFAAFFYLFFIGCNDAKAIYQSPKKEKRNLPDSLSTCSCVRARSANNYRIELLGRPRDRIHWTEQPTLYDMKWSKLCSGICFGEDEQILHKIFVQSFLYDVICYIMLCYVCFCKCWTLPEMGKCECECEWHFFPIIE